MLSSHTEVLAVGAGPAGLTLAVSLAQAGRDVTVVDAQAAAGHTSRAAVVHARTLEVLAPLGVAESLIAQGEPGASFAVRTATAGCSGWPSTACPRRTRTP